MHNNVEAIPVLAKTGEHGVNLIIRGDVTREEQIGVLAEARGEFLDATLQLLVLVRECNLRTFACKGFGDARSIATPTISAFLPAIKPIGFPQCESERRLF
jgi:hypothetical protein